MSVPIEEPYSRVAISSSIGDRGRCVVQYFHFQEAADINTALCSRPCQSSYLCRRCQCGPGVPGVPISTLSPPSHMSTLYSLCVSQLSLIMYLVAVCRYPYKAQHISILSVSFMYLMRYPYLLALVLRLYSTNIFIYLQTKNS